VALRPFHGALVVRWPYPDQASGPRFTRDSRHPRRPFARQSADRARFAQRPDGVCVASWIYRSARRLSPGCSMDDATVVARERGLAGSRRRGGGRGARDQQGHEYQVGQCSHGLPFFGGVGRCGGGGGRTGGRSAMHAGAGAIVGSGQRPSEERAVCSTLQVLGVRSSRARSAISLGSRHRPGPIEQDVDGGAFFAGDVDGPAEAAQAVFDSAWVHLEVAQHPWRRSLSDVEAEITGWCRRHTCGAGAFGGASERRR
jgi:hypothetical protein